MFLFHYEFLENDRIYGGYFFEIWQVIDDQDEEKEMVFLELLKQEINKHVELNEMIKLFFWCCLSQQMQNLPHNHFAFFPVFFLSNCNNLG
jgi:hypothetical protein